MSGRAVEYRTCDGCGRKVLEPNVSDGDGSCTFCETLETETETTEPEQ